MRTRLLLLLVLIPPLLGGCPASAPPPTAASLPARARVARVIDGDTIEVRAEGRSYRIRFARLAAPEMDTRAGRAAARALRDRIAGQTVRLRWGDDENRLKGYYGRWLARIYLGDTDIEQWMVRRGHGELAY